ncbi:hypothetical protein ACILDU_02295 [Capnocytophaga canimorsus]|uniref:hypothetical protein n=1 Tax=Capnocytophaga canimorsus TaxID=28188 RepID=UPI0037CD4597
MNAEEFVALCFQEKESTLQEYFNTGSQTKVSKIINALIKSGMQKNDLYALVDLILSETYYTLLLGLDGEASLGNKQVGYKIFDEKGNLLNERGEIEVAAFKHFIKD